MTQKALRFALEALDNLMYWDNGKSEYDEARDAIIAIKEALAQHDSVQAKPEPEQCKYPDCKCPTENPCLKGLAQEQKPVAWMHQNKFTGKATIIWDLGLATPNQNWKPLYTTPPQRTWVGLTDEDVKAVNAQVSQIPPIDYTTTTYAKAIEAKLKERNT